MNDLKFGSMLHDHVCLEFNLFRVERNPSFSLVCPSIIEYYRMFKEAGVLVKE